MTRLGEFIDVHVTRAQQVVALLVGVIALISAVVGGVVYVRGKFEGRQRPPELSWGEPVSPISSGDRWGPDRVTYTMASRPDRAIINSITDQTGYGDERDFFRVRNVSTGTDWTNSIELRRKDQFEASIYFHNDSHREDANFSYAQVEMPALVRSDEDDTNNFALGYVRASNAQPSEVHDSVSFLNNTHGDFALRYVPNTAHIVSEGGINGTPIAADALFRMDGPSAGGVRLGADSPDGVLPPGASGRVVFRFVAEQSNFDFENRVRIEGTKEWKRDLAVEQGQRVEFELAYDNTGDTLQNNVVMKAVWPQGVDYLHGQTKLWNSSNRDGKAIADGINGDGVNIGNYGPGANAFLVAGAIVTAPACSVIQLPASVETNNGNLRADSTVRVVGPGCPAP